MSPEEIFKRADETRTVEGHRGTLIITVEPDNSHFNFVLASSAARKDQLATYLRAKHDVIGLVCWYADAKPVALPFDLKNLWARSILQLAITRLPSLGVPGIPVPKTTADIKRALAPRMY